MAGSDEFKGSLLTSSQGTSHPDVIYYPLDASMITGEGSGRLASILKCQLLGIMGKDHGSGCSSKKNVAEVQMSIDVAGSLGESQHFASPQETTELEVRNGGA
jgi:hypothetical protein